MPVKLDTLIKKMEAAITTATDPKERRALQARLATYTSTKAEMDDGDEDEDDDDDEEESKAKKAAAAAKQAKKSAEAAKHRAKAADHKQKAAEYEEAAKKVEEDEDDEDESEEEAEARLRTYAPSDSTPVRPAASLTPGAAAALAGQNEVTRKALADIAQLKKDAEGDRLKAMIAEAVSARRITKPEAKSLASKSLEFVKDFLEMRPKALMATDEDDLVAPKVDAEGRPMLGSLSSEVMAGIDDAVKATGFTGDRAESIRQDMIVKAKKALAELNGAAPGRY